MTASSRIDLTAFNAYADARQSFLRAIKTDDSCRDPLSEFAEWVALQELGGQLANSRVQKGYDVISETGQKVQVKYLANPAVAWRNEHCVHFSDYMDQYAIVFFEDLRLIAMIVFVRNSLAKVCRLLKKRHPHQDVTLQLTNRNFTTIIDNQAQFEELGVLCFMYAATS